MLMHTLDLLVIAVGGLVFLILSTLLTVVLIPLLSIAIAGAVITGETLSFIHRLEGQP